MVTEGHRGWWWGVGLEEGRRYVSLAALQLGGDAVEAIGDASEGRKKSGWMDEVVVKLNSEQTS